MTACEKCWGDAYDQSRWSGKEQYTCYQEFLDKRKKNPCSPKEQAGQFWSEEKQCDKRDIEK